MSNPTYLPLPIDLLIKDSWDGVYYSYTEMLTMMKGGKKNHRIIAESLFHQPPHITALFLCANRLDREERHSIANHMKDLFMVRRKYLLDVGELTDE